MTEQAGRILSLAALVVLAATGARAQDQVRFATNWLAEAEHGGFYQALADGTYERYGLDVEIIQGGPQRANRTLLLAGRVEFYMSGNLLGPLAAAEQDVPLIEVAAFFQKEPAVLITHPEAGIEAFPEIADLDVIFLGADGYATYFRWMEATYPGFSEEQLRPYSFSPGPFLLNPRSAQQGYVTSEPYQVHREGGFWPDVFLLADAGFDSYSTLIEGRRDYVAENPDIVQRFVDASIIGWYTYLYGDNSAGNALIKEENPEMTDELLAYSLSAMKEYGIVDSGDALTGGIGCMRAERIRGFYETMVRTGVLEAGIDVDETFTTDFVCKGVGMELAPPR